MSRFSENPVSVRQTIMVSLEAVLLFSSIFIARFVNDSWNLEQALAVSYLLKCLLVTSILTICFYYNGLYDLAQVIKDPISSVIKFLRAFGTGAILLAIAYWLIPSLAIERDIVLTFLVVQLAVFTILRIGFFRWAITSPIFARRILIVGTDQMAMKIAREILQRVETGYTLKGFAHERHEMLGQVVMGLPVVCSYDQINEYCTENQVGVIVVALSDRRAQLPLWQLLECKMKGVLIEEVTAFYEKMTGQIMVEDIKPSSIIFSEGYRISRVQLTIKRLVDITLSLVGLILALPVVALAALLIRLNSRGEVFYEQERVGQHGKPFTLIKLRTMRSDAEKETGPVWTTANDPRVDPLGKFLRLTRVDEIPQMWNVLRGDMSFVGPRPERQFFIRELQEEIPFYIQRLAVKPGLTGWAQVRFHYAASKDQTLIKLQHDLYYIKHLSVFLDLIIVLDTVRVVILGKGQ
jgi:sugar transferase (PEP-CTERM system associated)